MRQDWPTLEEVGYPDASLFAQPTHAPLVAAGSVAGAVRDSNVRPAFAGSASLLREPTVDEPWCGTDPSSSTGRGHSPSRCSNLARTHHKEIADNPAAALAPSPLRPGNRNRERAIIDPLGGTPSGPTAEAANPAKVRPPCRPPSSPQFSPKPSFELRTRHAYASRAHARDDDAVWAPLPKPRITAGIPRFLTAVHTGRCDNAPSGCTSRLYLW